MGVIEESCAEPDSTGLDHEINVNDIGNLNGEGLPSKSKYVQFEDEDELSRLKALATDVREQDDLERDVGRQVCYTFRVHAVNSFNWSYRRSIYS